MNKIAFVFPGQGAQYVGMGKELAENYSCTREVFEKADEILGFSISSICFQGADEELNKTENTQPAILATSIAILKILQEKGIKADALAGLSLGEYSALVCSGALAFEEAVILVKNRGKYMQEAVPEGKGSMAAIIGLDSEKIYDICKEVKNFGFVCPANFNCPGQIVIAGEIEALKAAVEKCKERGAKRAVMLSVSAPFHTAMLQPAAIRLKKDLERITINKLQVAVLTNVTGDFIEDENSIKEILTKQVMSPVLWEQTINNMIKSGVDTFIEIGPGRVLNGFIKKIDRKLNVMNVEDIKSLEKTIEFLKLNA